MAGMDRDRQGCRSRAIEALVAGAMGLALLVGGCPLAPPGSPPGLNGPDAEFLDRDGNFTRASATALSLDSDGARVFSGKIDGANDLDLYNIGPLAPGDRLRVDVQTTSGDLDPIAAILDDREHLIIINDDRAPDASDLNPLLDFVIPGGQSPYYLGIIAFPGSGSTGGYRVDIRVTRGGPPPAPRPQIVFLNWAGGSNIVVRNVGVFDLPPFDAASLGPYAGQTEIMKDRIQQIVAERYAGLNLIVLNSDDHPVPSEPHSTIHFGGASRFAFAVSEQIDSFNRDPSDNTIIFTASYAEAFDGAPSFEQMAQAVGNTVAHEVGHLLGLIHTADCNELMDTSCPNESILRPQRFGAAPIDASVFPLGVQDSVELLSWILGPPAGG